MEKKLIQKVTKLQLAKIRKRCKDLRKRRIRMMRGCRGRETKRGQRGDVKRRNGVENSGERARGGNI